MDWIERLLHISPDGGSGVIEIAVAFTVALAICAFALIVIPKSRKRARAESTPGQSTPDSEL